MERRGGAGRGGGHYFGKTLLKLLNRSGAVLLQWRRPCFYLLPRTAGNAVAVARSAELASGPKGPANE